MIKIEKNFEGMTLDFLVDNQKIYENVQKGLTAEEFQGSSGAWNSIGKMTRWRSLLDKFETHAHFHPEMIIFSPSKITNNTMSIIEVVCIAKYNIVVNF